MVLVYHRVANTSGDPYGQAVRPETFAHHLELLARDHPIVSLGKLVEALPRRRYEDGSIAITFDDGYEDNLSQAWPIASRAGVPMTLFVTVQPVLEGGRFWWDDIAGVEPVARARLHTELKALTGDERRVRVSALGARDNAERGRPLTPAELRDFAARPGVEIGAHTLSHPSLASLPIGEQTRELVTGRSQLEEMAGQPITLLAYPFGKPDDVSAETETIARHAGYTAAFTTVPRRIVPSSGMFALPRLTVHEWPADALRQRVRACLG